VIGNLSASRARSAGTLREWSLAILRRAVSGDLGGSLRPRANAAVKEFFYFLGLILEILVARPPGQNPGTPIATC